MQSTETFVSRTRNLHLVIPMKDLTRAKSRLAELLPPDARRALVLEMLHRVLTTLLPDTTAPTTPATGIAQVWVMSADPTVRAMATTLGAQPMHDPTFDLNTALEWARTVVTTAGADALLIIPADVPLITPADLTALIDPLRAGTPLVLAPDRAESGTNALGVLLPSPLAFQFGPGSFAYHLDSAHNLGLKTHIYLSPTLAFDVDTPEDFIRYRG